MGIPSLTSFPNRRPGRVERVNLPEQLNHVPTRIRVHRQQVDDVDPALPVLIALAHPRKYGEVISSNGSRALAPDHFTFRAQSLLEGADDSTCSSGGALTVMPELSALNEKASDNIVPS